ncbi:MAG: hypothetical protein HPM95_04425 [Alphaproteobacteria bacterium]|nr:hypothetical protein [Alphaproteobacteria bacterium]
MPGGAAEATDGPSGSDCGRRWRCGRLRADHPPASALLLELRRRRSDGAPEFLDRLVDVAALFDEHADLALEAR